MRTNIPEHDLLVSQPFDLSDTNSEKGEYLRQLLSAPLELSALNGIHTMSHLWTVIIAFALFGFSLLFNEIRKTEKDQNSLKRLKSLKSDLPVRAKTYKRRTSSSKAA